MSAFRQLTHNPRLALRHALDQVRSSMWAAPTIGVVLAVIGVAGFIELDHVIKRETAWFLFDGGPESARELLSTVASSMLTFTALVFSITILVLQLASNQFSPRVIRTFLSERITKVGMAMFIGTFVYAIGVLSQVRVGPEPFVPGLATWVALVLVVASVGVFISYIHRMSQAVRAITIITKISAETRAGIAELLAERQLDATSATLPSRPPDVTLRRTGPPAVITYIDERQLASSVEGKDAAIEIIPRVGDFVLTGAPLLHVWGTVQDEDDCRAAIAFDIERTPNQDPAFGFRQIVDIAVRALSPGVNDPTTAVQALDHLHDLMRRLTCRTRLGPRCPRRHGDVTLLLTTRDYAELVRLAFEEIRSYGEDSVQVTRRLEQALRDLLELADDTQRGPLAEQLALLTTRQPATVASQRRASGQ